MAYFEPQFDNFFGKSTKKYENVWSGTVFYGLNTHHIFVNHRRKRGEKSETTITQCKKQLSSGEGGVIVLKRMSSFHSSNVKQGNLNCEVTGKTLSDVLIYSSINPKYSIPLLGRFTLIIHQISISRTSTVHRLF